MLIGVNGKHILYNGNHIMVMLFFNIFWVKYWFLVCIIICIHIFYNKSRSGIIAGLWDLGIINKGGHLCVVICFIVYNPEEF